jgi:hypothetical protein
MFMPNQVHLHTTHLRSSFLITCLAHGIQNLSRRVVKVARYSYHKSPAQESRPQNRVTIFTCTSRKLINGIPKWPDYSVLCQLLTSLEFSILEKQCAISLYFVWWPMSNFACCIAPLKTFFIQKIKKFCNAKKILPKDMTFSHFPKKWHYRIFLYFANC